MRLSFVSYFIIWTNIFLCHSCFINDITLDFLFVEKSETVFLGSRWVFGGVKHGFLFKYSIAMAC